MPVIIGETQHHSKLDLSQFLSDRNIILYFYPAYNTPGFSQEAQEFNLLVNEFEKVGAQVVGVSTDTKTSHTVFCDKYQLNFPLIADSDKRICQMMGVLKRGGNSALRITFVIDKKGIIRKIYENVKPVGHAKEVLEFLRVGLF
ncbi:MAG: peroxiredoxin Q/BCP [Candidatus Berkelbacteria bacterium Licking1014_7]|uniref:thioredoxin-dependent peroxiredoxin n=1 Tax=Candidatus Berkelbacteria bacterium Licking1014_7 TaxID=2017147 RepID=A0A554LJF2_9BACT|nr:MAG: peroxiredoxin Q/BCP [Candidatus Berkelbacteria bacterium Licking1014_7]